MVLRILKAPDGSRKLGFYNEHDSKRPYNSIPITLDTSSQNLNAMEKLRLVLINKKKNQEKSYQQQDLIGFDEI